ncbi:molybdopterin converting factor subunit 1 [Anoxybacillus rupiensis]|uniref:Molybdopterin synthase sulfur carrier subunit n=1 Tax=Anoxybacteroides rupiense TaxID=311460 RepID=A0ABT5W7C2_9BACL|nr:MULTISPECIES: molybdopterin converting factor subunit 1 [Anoxybacillus]KXG10150.1 Molybdopterin synthase sulfur carrier subunit [Anoxybacillus sp. P3H1B]MBB3907517.1 molybdopterin synthase sulfur carrier subunit [Anoxybacillus rupiensis]MBS2770505.1 molybdopterin converting factor subunit 1 [Anoxybacillus rupiensis]MDE8565234.1 molybdopterin converting factor subunit 1 [Anoxybacillus rupiensis]OQM46591.1 molybdopterin synthase sulfur carrier subunit [Anoxybacillus sp. UARK-01]
MITLLFFASLKEAVGNGQMSIEYEPITIEQLKRQIEVKYGVNLQNVMVAVNEEYAQENQRLQPGDVIAFIPPVSGG